MDYIVAVRTTHGQEGFEVPLPHCTRSVSLGQNLESGLSGYNGQLAYHSREYLRVEGQ